MYQIAICDDEKIFTDKLAHMIKQYSNAHHHVIDLHLFQQAADFIQSSLESYDIVFLDVRFGEISGIEVAKALRAKNENAILIFVSAFIEYATQYIFRTKVYIIQIFLSALSCLSLLPLAALKHDTRHLIRHKTFYIHPHLACLFSNILYWSTSFSSLSLMFLFYHTFRT